MLSRRKVSALLCGLGILLAPAVVQSAVVYRTSGVACHPEFEAFGVAAFQPESGFSFLGSAPVIGCSFPTSDATFTPSTLTQVNVRYYFDGAATVTGRMVFHDYDSPDFVECGQDADTLTTTGYRTLEIAKSCSSSSYDSSWGVVAAVDTENMHSLERLTVKVVTAYD